MADRNRQILYNAILEGNPLPIDRNIGRRLTFKQDNEPTMHIAGDKLKLLKAKDINV